MEQLKCERPIPHEQHLLGEDGFKRVLCSGRSIYVVGLPVGAVYEKDR